MNQAAGFLDQNEHSSRNLELAAEQQSTMVLDRNTIGTQSEQDSTENE
jgi:hypothetical protein